jgi:hypothetical protein
MPLGLALRLFVKAQGFDRRFPGYHNSIACDPDLLSPQGLLTAKRQKPRNPFRTQYCTASTNYRDLYPMGFHLAMPATENLPVFLRFSVSPVQSSPIAGGRPHLIVIVLNYLVLDEPWSPVFPKS